MGKLRGEGCLSGASAQQCEELKDQVRVPRMQRAVFTATLTSLSTFRGDQMPPEWSAATACCSCSFLL